MYLFFVEKTSFPYTKSVLVLIGTFIKVDYSAERLVVFH
jgi:hypothetical protein